MAFGLSRYSLASLYSMAPHNNQIDIIKLFSARAASELERSLAVSDTLMEKGRAQISLHSIGDGVITVDKHYLIQTVIFAFTGIALLYLGTRKLSRVEFNEL